MITLATLGKVRYFPELLPDTSVIDLAGGAVSAPIIDLRRFPNLYLRLKDIVVAQDAQVEMRVYADTDRYVVDCGAVQNLQPEAFDLEATEYLAMMFKASASKLSWRTSYSLWVYRPTIAHKLARGVPLSQEETEIAQQLNIGDTVEKGLLPLPLSTFEYQVEREYVPIHRYTKSRVLSLTGGQQTLLDTIMPAAGEFVVLEGIACDPGQVADNITITINRDEDYELVQVKTYPLSFDRMIPCWIPAMRELTLQISANNNVANWKIRYLLRRCRLTNIVRARWGLVPKEQLPGDVWAKVRGGVL